VIMGSKPGVGGRKPEERKQRGTPEAHALLIHEQFLRVLGGKEKGQEEGPLISVVKKKKGGRGGKGLGRTGR